MTPMARLAPRSAGLPDDAEVLALLGNCPRSYRLADTRFAIIADLDAWVE